ncbi:Na+, K+ ATPase alpha-subunit 2 [Clostridium botulinum B str. Osaka05]|uniref:Na+, K+ ATPase alpha-subunit 2 n=1 Tax=Clostridium botulinum B str. Osaka05 TaxID=1407017 RepID=A0A060N8N5_CLOBO|nr:hypothetical protein [Clostridium botulinum]BAO04813.1 Na+, K+ ATPase alpha-subunit 2 [Clostridium botulinum B str. Osaka05]
MFKTIYICHNGRKFGEQNFKDDITVIPQKGQLIRIKGMPINCIINYVGLDYEKGIIQVDVI